METCYAHVRQRFPSPLGPAVPILPPVLQNGWVIVRGEGPLAQAHARAGGRARRAAPHRDGQAVAASACGGHGAASRDHGLRRVWLFRAAGDLWLRLNPHERDISPHCPHRETKR
eukprot:7139959-Prymnesium_polylepis.1